MRRALRPALLLAALALVACSLVCAPGHCGANWPMWMENPAHSPTAQFEPEGPLTVNWTAWCRGIFGSPVVSEGAVYLATRAGRLKALDEGDSQVLWEVELCGGEGEWQGYGGGYWSRDGYRETGIIATPAVDEQCVYVGDMEGLFHARRLVNGEFVWERHLADAIASSALLLGDLVVVGTRAGQLVAMDRTDGTVTWWYDAGGAVNSSPAFADGKVVVGTSTGVIAVDAGTGALVWERQLPALGKFDSSPCIAGDAVYIASWGGSVVALGLGDGEVLWERSIGEDPIFASPAAAGALVYVSTTGGALAALAADSGESVWEAPLCDRRGRQVAAYASPVVCGPVVLAGCSAGRIHVFDAQDGKPVTTMTQGMVKFVHGTPVVTDEAIYVSSENPPTPYSGCVARLSCATDTWSARPIGPPRRVARQVQSREFAPLMLWALGIGPPDQPGGGREYGAWPVCGDLSDRDRKALNWLVDLGLVRSPGAWQRGYLRRANLAALYYNLFFDPNPFNVELPEFEPAELVDDFRYKGWLRNAPQLIAGLGLLEAPGGEFGLNTTITMEDLMASLRRAKELLGEVAIVQRESVRIVAQAPSPVQRARGGE